MYRIWIGLDAKMVLGAVMGGVSIIVLVIHLFAFKVVGYPSVGNAQKYSSVAPPVVAASLK